MTFPFQLTKNIFQTNLNFFQKNFNFSQNFDFSQSNQLFIHLFDEQKNEILTLYLQRYKCSNIIKGRNIDKKIIAKLYNKLILKKSHIGQMLQNPNLSKPKQPLGQIKVEHITTTYVTVILCTTFFSYYMAVSNGQEPPFPHATITNTACHYPQAIVFRWTMITAASFLHLLYWVMFRWLENQARSIRYPHPLCTWLYWPAQVSVWGYAVAMGTIDGNFTGVAHAVGAVSFLAILYFIIINITIDCHKMRNWDPSFMSEGSMMGKKLFSVYLTLVLVYIVVGLIFEYGRNEDDMYIVIMEWNLVDGGLLWVLAFRDDWKKLYISFQKGIVGLREQIST